MTNPSNADQSKPKVHYDFRDMVSTKRMALNLGIDPKTLRKWAKAGLIPSYVNPANNYRYYDKREVIRALHLGRAFDLHECD